MNEMIESQRQELVVCCSKANIDGFPSERQQLLDTGNASVTADFENVSQWHMLRPMERHILVVDHASGTQVLYENEFVEGSALCLRCIEKMVIRWTMFVRMRQPLYCVTNACGCR